MKKANINSRKQKEKRPVLRSETIRLNRFIANAGICSRREADVLIQSGVITVNGAPIMELGAKVNPDTDKVQCDGQTLSNEKMVYLLLNKPKNFETTAKVSRNNRSVMELMDNACKERIFPIGHLDKETTGLLLFTNDNNVSKTMSMPKNGFKRLFHVVLNRPLQKEHLEQISNGFELEDGKAKATSISYVGDDKTQIGIEIQFGKNRIIKRIFKHFGYVVTKLDRVGIAGLTKKDLPRGKYRFLTQEELVYLKRIK